MNYLKQQKAKIVATVLLMMLIGFGQTLNAQDEGKRESQSVSISTTEDGKVKLKVKKIVGNDETTFEKTYDSHEDMKNDPDLEKYGIDLRTSFSFGGTNSSPKFFLRNGPGNSFWDDHDFDVDSLRSSLRGMMKGFGPNVFSFGFDDDEFMDMDSLMQRFSFKNDNGRFFFNDQEFMDMDSLRDALKDQFGNMKFDFDFDFDDDDNGSFRTWRFGDDDDDVKVISRVKVFVRSASEKDKEVAGTEEMERLELRDINFYPNPSDGRFDVELETGSESDIRVVIVDPNGNEVYNRTGAPRNGRYDFRVDLSDEDPGIYIMKVVQNNKALTKRVIIE
ncbi:T9SS type A sorting domain-containing protein [Roseivirga sp.]|uniref:T9SS type A sorting domain-containing protein n=1 Tax=Roseivirga sp. TaxID=1964215 RepID=UPI003B8EA158